jgi:hypothetical protein
MQESVKGMNEALAHCSAEDQAKVLGKTLLACGISRGELA